MDCSSPQNSTPVRAESFYFDDDPMAVFLVEDQLFKVHRHFFIQGSEIFRDMFSQARICEGVVATTVEGMSDEKPIMLSQVTVKEFRTLLRYFYAMTLPMPNKKPLADVLGFTQDEKLALLSIAHQFVFDKIVEYICGEIEPTEIPAVDRVRLGDKYHLDKWLSSAYKTILERTPEEKLSREEVNALGVERVVKILEAKISILHETYNHGPQAWAKSPNFHCRFCNYTTSWFSYNGRSCNSCGRDISLQAIVTDTTAATATAITQAVEKLMCK